jgi:hypothetical protein
VRAGLGKRTSFRIGEPAFHQEARAFQALQGGYRVVAAQASGEGIGQPAREQVNLAGAAAHGPRRDHLDAHGQRACLERGHEFPERAAFPFGCSIGGRWSHAGKSQPSWSHCVYRT